MYHRNVHAARAHVAVSGRVPHSLSWCALLGYVSPLPFSFRPSGRPRRREYSCSAEPSRVRNWKKIKVFSGAHAISFLRVRVWVYALCTLLMLGACERIYISVFTTCCLRRARDCCNLNNPMRCFSDSIIFMLRMRRARFVCGVRLDGACAHTTAMSYTMRVQMYQSLYVVQSLLFLWWFVCTDEASMVHAAQRSLRARQLNKIQYTYSRVCVSMCVCRCVCARPKSLV